MKTSIHTLPRDLFDRHFVGFGSILDDFASHIPQTNTGFPPFDIIKEDDTTTVIELAIAGFKPEDISIVVENGILTIESEKTTRHTEDKAEDGREYVHRGISKRSFSKSWRLAEYWEVEEAKFNNGILSVTLMQEIPEAKKPKQIEIKS